MDEGCPQIEDCHRYNLTDYRLGIALCYVAMLSDVSSCVGSLAIILLYVAWKDLRTGAQRIITYLAVADLCSAVTYVVEDVTLIVNYSYDDNELCYLYYNTICKIITHFSMCAIMASYLWTAILALYFYLVVCNRSRLAMKLMPTFHVIAWGLPVVTSLPFLCTDTQPYAPFVSSVWCILDYPDRFYSEPYLGDGGVHVAVKLPEMLGYCFILLLYTVTIVSISKMARSAGTAKERQVQMRMACIPVIFVFLRIWNMVLYFYSSHVASLASSPPFMGCIPLDVKRTFTALSVLQGFEGGQGWVNCIVYIFLSKDMRKKLFFMFCKKKLTKRPSSLENATFGITSPCTTVPSNTYYSVPFESVTLESVS